MPKNKSRFYGKYGGVTKQNHYVPPAVAPFVPQPSSVQFTSDQWQTIETLLPDAYFTEQFILDHLNTLMLKNLSGVNTSGRNVYEIYTLADPNDIIVYEADQEEMRDVQNHNPGTV